MSEPTRETVYVSVVASGTGRGDDIPEVVPPCPACGAEQMQLPEFLVWFGDGPIALMKCRCGTEQRMKVIVRWPPELGALYSRD